MLEPGIQGKGKEAAAPLHMLPWDPVNVIHPEFSSQPQEGISHGSPLRYGSVQLHWVFAKISKVSSCKDMHGN